MGREGSTGCRGAGTGCVGTGGGNPPIDFSTSRTGTSTPAAERKWGPQGGRPDPPSWPVPQSPGEYGPVPPFREVVVRTLRIGFRPPSAHAAIRMGPADRRQLFRGPRSEGPACPCNRREQGARAPVSPAAPGGNPCPPHPPPP